MFSQGSGSKTRHWVVGFYMSPKEMLLRSERGLRRLVFFGTDASCKSRNDVALIIELSSAAEPM